MGTEDRTMSRLSADSLSVDNELKTYLRTQEAKTTTDINELRDNLSEANDFAEVLRKRIKRNGWSIFALTWVSGCTLIVILLLFGIIQILDKIK